MLKELFVFVTNTNFKFLFAVDCCVCARRHRLYHFNLPQQTGGPQAPVLHAFRTCMRDSRDLQLVHRLRRHEHFWCTCMLSVPWCTRRRSDSADAPKDDVPCTPARCLPWTGHGPPLAREEASHLSEPAGSGAY